jgi:uncharacterized protein YeaO (DUF488 family)
MEIKIKRVYEKPVPDDGVRVLVDRLWPRGLSKEKAKIDLWVRNLAPSNELRKWYGHEQAKWEEFKERYFAELAGQMEETRRLSQVVKEGPVTFLYSSTEEKFNNAHALKLFVEMNL